MKSSARNQWKGTVSVIARGAVYAEVGVSLDGGTELIATVTQSSMDELQLSKGSPVLALVKCTQITRVTDLEGDRLSTRYPLSSTLQPLSRGPVSTEVFISLAMGDPAVASVMSESANALALEVGQTANAAFKAGAVMLAAPM